MTSPSTDLPPLEAIPDTPVASILERLAQMGRVMVIVKNDRVTHERIGPMETVTMAADGLHLSGACHASVFDPTGVAQVQIDRRSVMQGKVYPRLNCINAKKEVLLSVVALDGVAVMEEALQGLPRTALPVEEKPVPAARGEAADIPESDPAMVLLSALRDSGEEVVITARSANLTQHWQGRIEAVKPAMGFVNVMTPDFHLHLKAGNVASWGEQPGCRIALDPAGQPCGLTLESLAWA